MLETIPTLGKQAMTMAFSFSIKALMRKLGLSMKQGAACCPSTLSPFGHQTFIINNAHLTTWMRALLRRRERTNSPPPLGTGTKPVPECIG
jgi:hypothetical protein